MIYNSEGYFKNQIYLAYSLANVTFNNETHSIHIRPSHPRYRDLVIRQALQYKPIGVMLFVTE